MDGLGGIAMAVTFSRKQLLQLGAAALGGTIVSALGCGDDETSGGPATSGTPGSGGTGNTGNMGGSTDGGGGAGAQGGGGMGQGGMGQGGFSGMCPAMITALISSNHGHQLDIPIGDVMNAQQMTYDTSGSSGHCHQVTVTMDDFLALQRGEVVRLKSCNFTDHEYVLSCAPNPPPAQAPDCSMDPTFGECP
jgi:hypothetical protein